MSENIKFNFVKHVRLSNYQMVKLKDELINHVDGLDSCSLLADGKTSLSFSSKIQLDTLKNMGSFVVITVRGRAHSVLFKVSFVPVIRV